MVEHLQSAVQIVRAQASIATGSRSITTRKGVTSNRSNAGAPASRQPAGGVGAAKPDSKHVRREPVIR